MRRIARARFGQPGNVAAIGSLAWLRISFFFRSHSYFASLLMRHFGVADDEKSALGVDAAVKLRDQVWPAPVTSDRVEVRCRPLAHASNHIFKDRPRLASGKARVLDDGKTADLVTNGASCRKDSLADGTCQRELTMVGASLHHGAPLQRRK